MANGEMSRYIEFIRSMSEAQVQTYIEEEMKRNTFSEGEIVTLKESIRMIRESYHTNETERLWMDMKKLTVEVLGGVANVLDTDIAYELYDFDGVEDWIDKVEVRGKRYSIETLDDFKEDVYLESVNNGVVLISVSRGVASDWYVPEGIMVDIRDYD